MRDSLSDGGVLVEVKNYREAEIAFKYGSQGVVVANNPRDVALITEIKSEFQGSLIFARIGHLGEIVNLLEVVDGIFLEDELPNSETSQLNKFTLSTQVVSACNDFLDVIEKMRTGTSMVLIEGRNMSETSCKLDKLMSDFKKANGSQSDRASVFNGLDASSAVIQALSNHFAKQGVAFPIIVVCAGGGVSCPANSALLRSLGCDVVVIDNEIFDKEDPDCWGDLLYATIEAVKYYDDPGYLSKLLRD